MFCRRWRPISTAICHQARAFTIAIDGPAASGKSSTARAVALELGLGYIDSGSIYRCATLLALRNKISDIDARHADLIGLISHSKFDIRILRNVWLNNEDVSKEIRCADVNRFVAEIARDAGVRAEVLKIQRSVAANAEKKSAAAADGTTPNGVVMDGRDIGSAVFPNAELKVYLDASAMARAIRRWDQMNSARNAQGKRSEEDGAQTEKPAYPTVEEIAREIEERDYADINRAHSPLRIAPDAVVIDNTNLTFEQQVHTISDLARERMGIPRKHEDSI
ncbi:Cytidylate kinase [Linderina pennispora]|uniref:(d)CMP kinase n=1 Tax=Linderina pennispora TaxID=61395 RepID=A0A1Y1WCM1_9FUNG|nr:Cytidylate kinase [Linderina pennispora]ORX71281.1 Cytidylate kinase [Linderina pennispora]